MKKLPLRPEDAKELVLFLNRVDFLKGMTVQALEIVLKYIQLYEDEKGEVVFKQGEPGDAFYVVYEGQVEIRRKKMFFLPSHTLAVLTKGDFFGEMALLDRRGRNATVRARQKSKLFVLLSSDFEFIVRHSPAFESAVRHIAEQRRFHATH